MTKKDRIAISISILLLLITAFGSAETGKLGPVVLLGFTPLVLYWAYRFIKNDISFLQRNPKTKNDKDIAAIGAKADELLKWSELLAKGAITQEEYEKAKRDLLS
jgi:uncharacterized membrane protein